MGPTFTGGLFIRPVCIVEAGFTYGCPCIDSLSTHAYHGRTYLGRIPHRMWLLQPFHYTHYTNARTRSVAPRREDMGRGDDSQWLGNGMRIRQDRAQNGPSDYTVRMNRQNPAKICDTPGKSWAYHDSTQLAEQRAASRSARQTQRHG